MCAPDPSIPTVEVLPISPRDLNPGPNARSNYWHMVWSCREARYRATYGPVKWSKSGSSPFYSLQRFLLRGGSSIWTRTSRIWRRDFSWTEQSMTLCSCSNGLMRDGLQLRTRSRPKTEGDLGRDEALIRGNTHRGLAASPRGKRQGRQV